MAAPRKKAEPKVIKEQESPAITEEMQVEKVESNRDNTPNTNYDASVTLFRDTLGQWHWKKDGHESVEGYNDYTRARMAAPQELGD